MQQYPYIDDKPRVLPGYRFQCLFQQSNCPQLKEMSLSRVIVSQLDKRYFGFSSEFKSYARSVDTSSYPAFEIYLLASSYMHSLNQGIQQGANRRSASDDK